MNFFFIHWKNIEMSSSPVISIVMFILSSAVTKKEKYYYIDFLYDIQQNKLKTPFVQVIHYYSKEQNKIRKIFLNFVFFDVISFHHYLKIIWIFPPKMCKSHMFILTYFWRENSNKCKLAMLKMRLFRNFITLWKGLKMKEVVEMHKSKFEVQILNIV